MAARTEIVVKNYNNFSICVITAIFEYSLEFYINKHEIIFALNNK